MDIARELFSGFVTSIRTEIESLKESGVLDHCRREHRRGWVLNGVLKEDTLRFFSLREFYKAIGPRDVKFDTEVRFGKGPIDLVLEEDGERFAFEFKRWHSIEHKTIQGKDYDNLLDFMKTHRQGY